MIHKPSTRPPRLPATHAYCRYSESAPVHPWNVQASGHAFHAAWSQQLNAHALIHPAFPAYRPPNSSLS
eukprot:28294-Prymnesium_polylepis.1